MADGFTPIAIPARNVSAQVAEAAIKRALDAGDTAKAERLRVLWLGYLGCGDVF